MFGINGELLKSLLSLLPGLNKRPILASVVALALTLTLSMAIFSKLGETSDAPKPPPVNILREALKYAQEQNAYLHKQFNEHWKNLQHTQEQNAYLHKQLNEHWKNLQHTQEQHIACLEQQRRTERETSAPGLDILHSALIPWSQGLSWDQIHHIQSRLQALGLETGPVDGRYGPRTHGALLVHLTASESGAE